MSKEKSSSNLGVLIIIIGVAILLANLNVLSFSMFWGIVKLWPFLLIIAGLSIIFKRVRYINVILWLGFLGVVIGYSYLNFDDKTWFFGDTGESIETIESITEMTQGIIELDIHHGNIDITSKGDDLVYSVPTVGIKEASFEKNILIPSILRIDDDDFDDFMLNIQTRDYDIILPEKGVWSLDLDGGVISGDFDFSNRPLTGLDIDFGVGDLDIFFNDKTEGKFKLNIGVGDIELNIPDEVGVKLTSKSGLVSVEVPNHYTQSGDVYHSDNYEDAEYQLEIIIDIGVGTFQIK